MTNTISLVKRVINDQYYEDLKTDKLSVGSDIIENALLGEAKAFHHIGCIYSTDGNKEKATVWLGVSAAMGYSKSQLELGHIFNKDGNNTKAIEWYIRAMENGNTSAPMFIGEDFFQKKEYGLAKSYFQKSADLGNFHGQYCLGLFFRDGYNEETSLKYNDVSKKEQISNCYSDYKSAMVWFRKSADQGYNVAQYEIGKLYENGQGFKVDIYLALEWYHKSSARGYEPAKKSIERLCKQGYTYIPTDSIKINKTMGNDIIPVKNKELVVYGESMTSEHNGQRSEEIGDQQKWEYRMEISNVNNELKLLKNDHPELNSAVEKLENIINKISLGTLTVNKE